MNPAVHSAPRNDTIRYSKPHRRRTFSGKNKEKEAFDMSMNTEFPERLAALREAMKEQTA